MHTEHLFHISEDEGIAEFVPRPSPQYYPTIKGEVVFAVGNKRLHNYLLPRNCPRVCYWQNTQTSQQDITTFFDGIFTQNVIVVEQAWLERVANAKLYCYEFSADDFELLDKNADYYISYHTQQPIRLSVILNPIGYLAEKNTTLLTLPSLSSLAKQVAKSTLCYSLIRM